MQKMILVRPLVALCLLLNPLTSWGWGLSSSLKNQLAETRLIAPIYRHKAIRYCVEIVNDSELSQKSLEAQTEAALKVWLEPLKEIGISDTKLILENCASKELDFRLRVGKMNGTANTYSAAYYDVFLDQSRLYSNVVFNTEYIYPGNPSYSDFIKIFPEKVEDLVSYLMDLGSNKKLTIDQLASERHADTAKARVTTYPMLLHEVGHAFGLCDTYKPDSEEIRRNIDCEEEYLRRDHPDSVMKLADRMYLTDDDKAGLLEAFKSLKGRFEIAQQPK